MPRIKFLYDEPFFIKLAQINLNSICCTGYNIMDWLEPNIILLWTFILYFETPNFHNIHSTVGEIKQCDSTDWHCICRFLSFYALRVKNATNGFVTDRIGIYIGFVCE